MVRKVRSRGKKVELSPEQRQQVVDLHKRGLGYTKISEETGYSRWTVALVLKESGAMPPAPARRNGAHEVRTVAERKEPQQVGRGEAPQRPAAQPARRTVAKKGGLLSAAELSAQISAAEQEAREYGRQINWVADELAQLWERAEYLAQHEEALGEALAALKVLKERADTYKRRLDQVQQESLQRSMAIHSESKSLTRE